MTFEEWWRAQNQAGFKLADHTDTIARRAWNAARDAALEEGRLKSQRTDKARVAWREAWHLENRWTNPDSDVEWPQVSEAVAKARALDDAIDGSGVDRDGIAYDAECEEGNDGQ